MENLGLTKNLLYGSLLGLICSAVLLFILNKFLFPDYLYLRDEMKQTSEGGALTLVAIYLCVVGALQPKEFDRNKPFEVFRNGAWEKVDPNGKQFIDPFVTHRQNGHEYNFLED